MAERLSSGVIRLIKKLEMAMNALSDNRLPSKYRKVFLGSGLDFEEFKEYTSGDDSSFIDWKATVRAQKTMMKVYKEERDLEIFFLIDTSNSMIFGSGEKLKLQTAIEFVAVMAYMIITVGDNVGMTMFSDKIKTFISPGSTMDQYYIILRTLIDKKNYMGGFDLEKAMRFVMNISRRRGVIFLVTDFLGMKPRWEETLKLISAKYELIGVMVKDPRDVFLPTDTGHLVLGDPYSKQRIIVNPKRVKEDYERVSKEKEEMVKKIFNKINGDLFTITTDTSFIRPLISYLKKREQLLWK